MSKIQTIDILKLNALGPYNHGTWTGEGRRLGAEEALDGRAMHIVNTFVSCLEKAYSRDELRKMTLVDIGCYDGFLAVEIEKRIQLKRIVGVEPREKNIQKGLIAREYCGIHTQVEFKVGDIQSLAKSGETFDIVFCSGVFHHLENIDAAIKLLYSCCTKAIFVESQVYYSPKESMFKSLYDKYNIKVIEPKDIIYKFIPKSYSLSGFKFETNYYDGSASGFSLVNVPSPEMIQMSLEANGFSNVKILSMGSQYKKNINSKLRDFHAACLFAKKDINTDITEKISKYIETYETSMIGVQLEKPVSQHLSDFLSHRNSFVGKLIISILTSQNPFVFKFLSKYLIERFGKNETQKEILANIKYSPNDKIRFEVAKTLFHERKYSEAREILMGIVSKPNADWRITYRSFALLAIMAARQAMPEEQKYRHLCVLANQNYPIEKVMGNIK